VVQRIALFCHKGGVSKTTTTFSLGWILAEKGHRVIIVDGDPQCNLTGMVLGFEGVERFDEFYSSGTNNNIKSGLAPAFEAQPRLIEAAECVPVRGRDGLFLLPGHIQLAEYEVTLGLAQDLTSAIMTLANLPGSIANLLDRTASRYNAEYVLIDLNPSLSSVNQNILMTSNFFIVPTSPDYFSLMAINSLTRILTNWIHWAQRIYSTEVVQNSTYPFPRPGLRFLGTIIQNFRKRGGVPARAFQEWIDRIQGEVRSTFAPALRETNSLLSDEIYRTNGVGDDYTLSTIPNFNSLIAKSQKYQTPVFALTDGQLGQSGVVLQRTRENREEFHRLFSDLADKVIGLTSNAASGQQL
jgi:cellulose biosynthesis protein BcsQ